MKTHINSKEMFLHTINTNKASGNVDIFSVFLSLMGTRNKYGIRTCT